MSAQEEADAHRKAFSSEPTVREMLGTPGYTLENPGRTWDETETLELELPSYIATEMKTVLDPADWNTGFLSVEERPLPQWLLEALKENSPQASLRDLFRPVRRFVTMLEPLEGTGLINEFAVALADAHAARVLEPIPVIGQTVDQVKAEQRRRRDFVAEKWLPIRSDEEERRKVTLYQGDEESE